MNLLGIHLTLLIGPTVAVPAPPFLVDALDRVEVTHDDAQRSGFQLTFRAGRGGSLGALDYPLLTLPLLRSYNRVILVVTFNATPRVLFDGVITHQELSPGAEPGTGTLTVTGLDVSVMMDRVEKPVEHPAQDETIIANKLILSYAQYGLIPEVIPPPALDPPLPTDRIPVQLTTDFAFLREMAARYGYVFYVSPGPVPFTNTAYWGPPKRVGVPQSALTVNMGTASNTDQLSFRYDAETATTVSGQIQDRLTNQTIPVLALFAARPPLAAMPAWLVNQPNVRQTSFDGAGLNVVQAYARALGMVDAASDVLTVDGQLDALRYGGLLQPRGLVGLRGAGYLHDGLYYVKRVTHQIGKGSYTQRFTMAREGLGSTTPAVIA